MKSDQPQTTIRTYDHPTTPEGLAFALLGCLDFGADGKSLPVFQASGIELIRGVLAAERERCAMILQKWFFGDPCYSKAREEIERGE